MAIQISDNIASASRTANLDAKFGPYTSKQAVIDELVSDGSNILAVNGLTVGVIENNNVVEYVFKNVPANPTAANVTVNNLFLKQVAVQEETDPTVPAWAKQETKPSYTANEVGAIPSSEKGVAGGVATLGSDGKVPQSQLPSYVDDVLEYSNQSSFPSTGESGKIYVALDTNKTYRWSGSAYVEISQSLALGETSSTAFAGDRGKAIEGKIPSNASSSNKMVTASDLSGKVDKVSGATENYFAAFDSDGGIQYSGYSKDSFATAAQGEKADNAIPMPTGGSNEYILAKDSNETAGVKWVEKPTNGKSAYQLYYDAEVDAGRTPLSPEAWLASLKANIGAFKFVSYDQSAESDFTTGGIGTTYSSAIDNLVAGTDTTPDIILLMNNTDGTTVPTKTFMIATQEASTPGTYEFVYAGDLQSAMPSNVLTEDDIDNSFVGGSGKVASADEVKDLKDDVDSMKYIIVEYQSSEFTTVNNTVVYVSGQTANIGYAASGWIEYKKTLNGEVKFDIQLGSNSGAAAGLCVIAFCSNETPSSASVIISSCIERSSTAGVFDYNIEVPDGAKSVIISNYTSQKSSPKVIGYIPNVQETKFATNQKLEDVSIVDNLNSDSVNDVLSAKQGKVLKTDIDAVEAKVDSLNTKISDVDDFTKVSNVCVDTASQQINNGTTLWDEYRKTINGESYFDISIGNKKGFLTTLVIISFYTSETPSYANIISDSIVYVQDETGTYSAKVNVPANAKSVIFCNQKEQLTTPTISGYASPSGAINELRGRVSTLETEVVDIEESLSLLTWEQGGISQSTGVDTVSTSRIRSNYIRGNFEIKLKDGYVIQLVSAYDIKGSYIYDMLTPQAGYTQFSCQSNLNGLVRIVVRKTDGTATITPDDDFLAEYVGGDDYESYVYDDKKVAVDIGYEYKGDTSSLVLPTSADAIYNVWNSLYEKYPKFVTRETLGYSRKYVEFTLDNLDSVPFILSCNAEVTEGTTVYVNDLNHPAEVLEVYYNQYSGSTYFTMIKCTNGADSMGTSGSLKDSNGNTLTTYSNVLCGKCQVMLNGNSNQVVDIAFIHIDSKVARGALINEEQNPSETGYITYDGQSIANYSNLSVHNGEPIYCYTVDFCTFKDRYNLKRGMTDTILYLGATHGYERKAALGGTMFFEQLFNNWKDDKYLETIRSGARFVVIPCVNPFGIRFEKNYNARGVDLNRNFSDGFEASPQLYFRWSGDSAFSEPESLAIKTKIDSIKNNISHVIDYHGENGPFASFVRTYFASKTFYYATGRAMAVFFNRLYDWPLSLYAWKNGTTVKYTDTATPIVGDKVYNATTLTDYTVSGVGESTMTSNGVVYSRDSSSDFNTSNFDVLVISQGGAIVRYAASLGIRMCSNPEVESGYYLTTTQGNTASIEIIGNFIYATVKYFMM